MRLTYSVTPQIRKDKLKANGTCPIYFFVRVGQHVTKVPTGKYITPKDWDSKKNCAKPSSLGNELNRFLTKRIYDFNQYALKKEAMGQTITTIIATAFFKENTEMTLCKFWNELIKSSDYKKAKNTIKSYKSTLNILMGFNPKLNFGDLSLELIEKFDRHMTINRKNAIGGRFTKHKVFRYVINEAIKKQYLQINPYKHFPIQSAEGKRLFLSIDEVNDLLFYDVPNKLNHLQKIKDMFLFACFTGLRYSDVIGLKTEHIKVDDKPRLEFIVTKTNRLLMIPLNTFALDIIKAQIIGCKSFVFPRITNQALNRELKQLIGEVNIVKKITFHCARHTFACNHIENNTSIMRIKDLLGHRDVKHTQIYAKTLNKDLYESVNELSQLYLR